MGRPIAAICMDCGRGQPYSSSPTAQCQSCGSVWLEPHYDYLRFKREVLQGLPGRPHNIWRYQDVLPINEPENLSFVNVGWTPLEPSLRYAQSIGLNKVYIKDERYGPTSSFKDRQAVLTIAAAVEANIPELVIASTGNAAVAFAAACARAGIKLWVFMTSEVPQEKLRETALYGAEVVRVNGSYEQTKQIAQEFAKQRGLLFERGARSIPARESMKTIAYEIVEQLGWQAPDWYVQAVSGGLGPLGIYRGFEEMLRMGLIDRIPNIAILQAEGCAPMARAFQANQEVATPVPSTTRIAILSTADPGKTYTLLYHRLKATGGAMEYVSDEAAFTSMRSLAKTEGMAVEPASAVAFAGFEKLVSLGVIQKEQTVVINCTGHTFPVEKHVLGDQWNVDIDLSRPAPAEEKMDRALDHLEEKTITVLIVDDNPDDAQLLRRILETLQPVRILHAPNGLEGLAEARQRLPGLIILDLMMPNLDGFSLLDELKTDDRTADIPVIVISAKDLTSEEVKRLSGRIEGIHQKGLLSIQTLRTQVASVLEKKRSRGG